MPCTVRSFGAKEICREWVCRFAPFCAKNLQCYLTLVQVPKSDGTICLPGNVQPNALSRFELNRRFASDVFDDDGFVMVLDCSSD